MPDLIPPEPQKPRRPLVEWFESQRPAIRALIVGAVITAVNQSAPWLAPLVRALAGGAGQ